MSVSKWLRRPTLLALAGSALTAVAVVPAAYSLTVELKDVAADRIERQRASSSGNLPLPGTPNLASFEQRLSSKGLKAGDDVFIRIFKAESDLEVWIRSGSQFVLLDTYPICYWSGTLGPKLHEGDKQTPEGFYEVTRKQLHLVGRHPRSLNLGFPNTLDKTLQRTGSYILVHGGCSSVGCFAMTNAVVAEIYDLAERALKNGQDRVHVHVFPFRMTDTNLDKYRSSEWYPFWHNLKEGHDAFEQTRVPPQIGICDKRYLVQASAPEEVGGANPFAVCGDTVAAMIEWDRLTSAARPQQVLSSRPSQQARRTQATQARRSPPVPSRVQRSATGPSRTSPQLVSQRHRIDGEQARPSLPSMEGAQGRSSLGAALPSEAPCDLRLASCRKWSALQNKVATRAAAFRDGQIPSKRGVKTATRSR